MVIDRFVHRFRFFLAHRSISMHADARGTNRTYEQKKSGTIHWPRERHHSQLGIRYSFHTKWRKKKKGTEREGDREIRTGFGRDARFFLGNYGNGTEVCFEGTVTTCTFARNKKGEKDVRKEREVSHSRWLDQRAIDDSAQLTNADDRWTRISELLFGNFIFAKQTEIIVNPLYRI